MTEGDAAGRALPAGWRRLGLLALYELLPNADCDGCDGCGAKCAGDVPMAREEYERIRARAPDVGPGPVPRRGPFAAPCRFRDEEARRCGIYPVRPLICRLFGLVEWLPCPLGRWPVRVPEGPGILEWYRERELRTYPEWFPATETVSNERPSEEKVHANR